MPLGNGIGTKFLVYVNTHQSGKPPSNEDAKYVGNRELFRLVRSREHFEELWKNPTKNGWSDNPMSKKIEPRQENGTSYHK